MLPCFIYQSISKYNSECFGVLEKCASNKVSLGNLAGWHATHMATCYLYSLPRYFTGRDNSLCLQYPKVYITNFDFNNTGSCDNFVAQCQKLNSLLNSECLGLKYL